MAKTVFTEREIDDLYARGITRIELDEATTLTDLAYEKAHRLGFEICGGRSVPPAAPERPYLSRIQQAAAGPSPAPRSPAPPAGDFSLTLKERVTQAVRARLGDQISPQLVEKILQRILQNVGGE